MRGKDKEEEDDRGKILELCNVLTPPDLKPELVISLIFPQIRKKNNRQNKHSCI